MTESGLRRPTDAELAILRTLWQRGPGTVRQVLEALNERREIGYTTVLKLLQIMTEKGLVERDESQRTHIYRAKLSRSQTQQQLVGDLLDKAFGGSASQLVIQILATKPVSAQEIAQIRQLIERVDGRISEFSKLRSQVPSLKRLVTSVLEQLEQKPATVNVQGKPVIVGRKEVEVITALMAGELEFVTSLPLFFAQMRDGDFY